MITVTKIAEKQIEERCIKHNKNGVRLKLAGGGCAGFKYEWEMVDHPDEKDYINGRLVIDDLSYSYLWGSIIDYKETPFEECFEIHNMGETVACGCGESVGF